MKKKHSMVEFYSDTKIELNLIDTYRKCPVHVKFESMIQQHKRSSNLDGIRVVLTEKIHGTNICVAIQNGKINLFKRNGFIDINEQFYNVYHVISLIQDKLLKLSKELSTNKLDIVRIYGELYGGDFNNVTDKGNIRIQKDMNYCPHNAFDVFEIIIERDSHFYYLSWDELVSMTDKFDIRHVPEITRGIMSSIEKSIDIETLQSRIPNSHGLDNSTSRCEGVVIRPEYTGISGERGFRIKWKNMAFLESPLAKKTTFKTNHSDKTIIFLGYMNQNRFDCYISKVGPKFICKKNIRQITLDIYEDILIDINDISEYIELTDVEKKRLKKQVSARIFKFLKVKL